ncbi:SGNH/GDSL hydrolase family protein [Nakamurella sp. YIM 132087]|uniref:SGNH/GDSL hydrolase family protein n=1 Tax=Nakamurella alba TaxID=2665158 RepID=A0A7K1FJC2_9ACTN|nr:SGNH/GDSL hydrolase family protein [Nakamurella alba]MTD12984.1 SGNH/GDSL hydrolase family protein [Nakamurella alba]
MGLQRTRFVAIGDSFTEGLGDARADGSLRGWADLVAPEVAGEYANLAIRGKLLGAIIDEQLEPALELEPDLVTFAGGGNDVLRPRADLVTLRRLYDLTVARLVDSGASVVLFTGADPSANLPLGAVVRSHGDRYCDMIREVAARRGALLVDLWAVDELRDLRFWAADHLHLNAAGHARVAGRELDVLDLPVPAGWTAPVPPVPPSAKPVRDQVHYYREFVGPWVQRRLTGRSSGDHRSPKIPAPVTPSLLG